MFACYGVVGWYGCRCARHHTRQRTGARAVGAWGRWNQWYRRYGRARAALASERAISGRYRRYGRSGSGTARQASGASQKSPSSPVQAFSLLERSVKKRKRLSWYSPTGRLLRRLWRLPAQSRQYGRARAALASERGGRSPQERASGASRERAGIPRLKKCFTLFGCAKPGAIAGETLYIYTRSVLIMMIVTPSGGGSVA